MEIGMLYQLNWLTVMSELILIVSITSSLLKPRYIICLLTALHPFFAPPSFLRCVATNTRMMQRFDAKFCTAWRKLRLMRSTIMENRNHTYTFTSPNFNTIGWDTH
ncbi:hypothetical protein OCU04_001480 [Sclerotinia nivalis]|uniref:Uncharacterized protein n=1 Tax=Sclerotinia nivalis TaxID=352851 RepID=A0A9X0AYL3_9HELO|nr:hypothetical protein OCU04_001480 [Sclerotinia nivalis]